MNDLPMLYLSAPPESILWLAVRAVAFADMRNQSAGNVPFNIKARQYYGAALNRTRMVVHDQQNLANDRILSAILLIDNFEVLWICDSTSFFRCILTPYYVAYVLGPNRAGWSP
jgi:hypothetical protein